MQKNGISKSFFTISFLPAIIYWYLEENYPLNIAIIGGTLLSILEISLEKLITKHVHKISWFNFFLIVGLGGISLLGDDGIWFRLQPCFTGVVMGIIIWWNLKKGKGLMEEMIALNQPQQNSHTDVRMLENHLAYFMFAYGIFMGFVAYYFSTGRWLFFKTIGFYISASIFMLFEFIYLLKKKKQQQEKRLL